MKTLSRSMILTVFAIHPLMGQGDVVPPGAPAPAMKRLDEVEPRIIVNATNTMGDAANTFIISAPGSYYFTGNITGEPAKHGISIQANDVTLDLNGFALLSGGGSALRGINTPAAQNNLSVRNGSVRGWSGGGVWAGAATTLAEKLRLADNTGGTGLVVGNGSLVKDCVSTGNAIGFFLPDRTHASHCIATLNTGHGFDCTSYVTLIDCTSSRNQGGGIVTLGSTSIIRCTATRNLPSGHGINAGTGCTVAECTAGSNGMDGIRADSGSTIRGCTAQANGAAGIVAASSSQITGNTCDSNPTGILITGHYNRVDGNLCHIAIAAGKGFHIQGTSNVVVRNTARGPLHQPFPPGIVDTAYTFDSWANNSWGPIHPSGGGEIPASLSPWANFQNF